MVRIVTDSAADFSREEAEARGLTLLPLNIIFDDQTYNQEDDPGFHRFYELLRSHKKIPSTSQASPMDYMNLFIQAKQAGDELVAITLSSGLSSTYQSGLVALGSSGCDKIYVVDSTTAIIGQRILVDHALKLRDEGRSGAEIMDRLLTIRDRVRVYGLLDTLEYLRKGGRIPASAAMLGTLLNVKPVIVVKDGVLGMVGKARGVAAGLKLMADCVNDGPKIDPRYPVYFGYTSGSANCEKFRGEISQRYGLREAPMFPIGGVVGTHIGEGAVAIAYVEAM